MTGWDTQSGIRERLALLAELGPTVDPHNYGYNPSRDRWYYCGDTHQQGRTHVEVKQEGSASLDLIHQRYQIDRANAMNAIGFPERVR